MTKKRTVAAKTAKPKPRPKPKPKPRAKQKAALNTPAAAAPDKKRGKAGGKLRKDLIRLLGGKV